MFSEAILNSITLSLNLVKAINYSIQAHIIHRFINNFLYLSLSLRAE